MTIRMTALSPTQETEAELRAAVVLDSTVEVANAIDRALYAAIQTLTARLRASCGSTAILLSDMDRRTGVALADLVCESLITDLPCDVKAIVRHFDEYDVVGDEEIVVDQVTSHAHSVVRGLSRVQ